jgi:hypothetical protein
VATIGGGTRRRSKSQQSHGDRVPNKERQSSSTFHNCERNLKAPASKSEIFRKTKVWFFWNRNLPLRFCDRRATDDRRPNGDIGSSFALVRIDE